MSEDFTSPDITSNDRLWAALGYPVSLLAIFALFVEEKKDHPFIRYHAVQAIALNFVLYIPLALIVPFVGLLCFPLLWLVSLWPAYDAYRGNYTELPVITTFIKNQGWV